jgi:hypothetical protein
MQLTVDDSVVQGWKQLLDNKMLELKHDLSDSSAWTFYMEKDNVQILYKTVENDPNTKYKGKGRIKTKKSPGEFLQWLNALQRNLPKRKEYVNPAILEALLIQVQQLTQENENNDRQKYVVEWLKLLSPSSLVSNRDFQYIMKYDYSKDDEAYAIGSTIIEPGFPEDASFVRSSLKLSGWYIKQGDGNYLDAIYVCHTDPSGWVPAWVVNQFMYDQVLLISKYSNLLEQEEK